MTSTTSHSRSVVPVSVTLSTSPARDDVHNVAVDGVQHAERRHGGKNRAARAVAADMPDSSPRTRISAGLILLLSALTAVGPLTFDTYLAAFPQIADDLSASPATVQLTLTASLAGLAM